MCIRDRNRPILESRFTGQQGYDASSRERCLGARLLPEIPEQTRRLSERMVGSRQLGRRRNTLREGEITLELIFLPEGGNNKLPPCSCTRRSSSDFIFKITMHEKT